MLYTLYTDISPFAFRGDNTSLLWRATEVNLMCCVMHNLQAKFSAKFAPINSHVYLKHF